MAEKVNEVADSAGNSLRADEEKPLCDNCKKIDFVKATLAERLCIKCDERLCISCSKEHEKKKDHFVVALNDQKESQKCKEFDFCIDHNDELAELFCISCRKVICCKCLEDSHSSHNFSRVEDVAKLVSKQTEAEYENLFYIQSHFDKERETLLSEKIKVMKTVKEMEIEIQKRCDEITELVNSEKNALLKELDVFKKDRLEEIEMETRKMEEHVFTFKKFKAYCDQIKSNRNPRYTCEAEGVLRSIVDDLKIRLEGRWKSGLFQVQISIQKTDIEQALTSLGKLIIRCPYKMTQSTEVKLDEKEVYGMARLHDKFYVISKSIFIRRLQHPFASVGEIKTPEIQSPKVIASCPKTSCLYIHDNGKECVWKVSVPDHRVSRWLSEIKEPCVLSVTSNAELLMLRNNKPVCLEVYNEHAILLRRLKLPATIPSVCCFYETPSGKYFGLGEQSVCALRRNGSIISQFELSKHGDFRSKPRRFDMSPCHIFLHCDASNRNNSYCGSISALTFDLESHQILVYESEGWRTPLTSCYLKETKQLLVLEEIVLDNNKIWKLRAYDVLPQ